MPPKTWTHSLQVSLLILAPFDLLASLGMDIYLPVVPRMPDALHTTPATIQLTLSVYMLVLGCGQLAFGPLSDWIGRRPVLLGGALLFDIASAALAVTGSGPVFVTLRVAQAAGAAATLVATFATVRDVFAGRPESVLIYSVLGSMLGFVPALGPAVGAGIAYAFGWPGIFASLALLGALASVQVLLLWPETRPPSHSAARLAHVRDILTNKPFLIYTLGYSTSLGAFFVYFSISSRVLLERIGLTPFAFSVVFATVALVMIATSGFSARLATRWGERGCLIRGMTLLSLGGALFALCQLLADTSLIGFIAPMWLVAVGISVTCAVTANGAQRAFSHVAGTATALYACGESLFASIVGTAFVVFLPADTAWPLAAFCGAFGLLTAGLARTLPNS
jgi:DHA1 family florfenicol/chloramphenicol resistance protein-like MFS transporter